VPRPLRELAQRIVALRRMDTGRVDVPPPGAKRRHLQRLFQERGHSCFVEAGTYRGDTVAAFRPLADRVISVEMDEALWRDAAERFRGDPAVEIVKGDAEREIPRLVASLDSPPLVWLDGHYSGEGTALGSHHEPAVAILEDLGRVDVPPGTTIVVDDLRLFGRLPEFPSLESLVSAARTAWPDASIYVGLDSLVVAL
jgi:hypothetical protein